LEVAGRRKAFSPKGSACVAIERPYDGGHVGISRNRHPSSFPPLLLPRATERSFTVPSRIFVTGATGVVGIRAVSLLAATGREVTAVGRSPEKRARLESVGARAVSPDLFDRVAMQRALEGHDTVINLATHMPPSTFRMMLPWEWRENDRIRREGSALLVDA